jgi:hypothetical protein
MTDSPVLACMRMEDGDPYVPSEPRTCTICTEPVWTDPKVLKLIVEQEGVEPVIVCITCLTGLHARV